MVKVKYKVAGGEAVATFKEAIDFFAHSESGVLSVTRHKEGEPEQFAMTETIAVFAAGEWIYAESLPEPPKDNGTGRYYNIEESSLDSSQLAYGTGRS